MAGMAPYTIWLVIGIALIIVEFTTGTLYLLVLGLAALVSAAAAWLGFGFGVQVTLFALAAIAAMLGVRQYRATRQPAAMESLEVGQPVAFESWVDAGAHLARVRFRGSSWDARIEGFTRGEAGEVLYVNSVEGAMLTVSSRKS